MDTYVVDVDETLGKSTVEACIPGVELRQRSVELAVEFCDYESDCSVDKLVSVADTIYNYILHGLTKGKENGEVDNKK